MSKSFTTPVSVALAATFLLFFSGYAKAGVNQLHNSTATKGFIENKGQIVNQHFSPNSEVKYLFVSPGLNVQLKANSFSYDAYVLETENRPVSSHPDPLSDKRSENITYKSHRVDISFIGANPNPQIRASMPLSHTFHYYTAGTNGGVSNVKQYQQVIYKNLYPNIDLEFVTTSSGVKYNFIVLPGGDASKIKWTYSGSNTASLKNGSIQLGVQHGVLEENIPESFIQETRENVQVNYIQNENVFSFQVPTYDHTKTLVIDPNPDLNWATYFGGNLLDYGSHLCKASDGHVLIVGYTASNSNIATNGTHQSTYGGGVYDAFVAKFDSLNGTLIWATYYGGGSIDYGHGIAADANGFIYFCGETNSTGSISTLGAHQTALGGGASDAFAAKLNNQGIMQWATYYGGSLIDVGEGIAVDKNGNVYMSGYSSSTGAISSPGSHQTNLGGGAFDGFLVKFNGAGVRQWGTYYGGNAEDRMRRLTVDTLNNVYVTGFTGSQSAIATPGTHQPVFGGNNFDAFIVKFNTSGVRQWGTYYGGNLDDYGFEIAADPTGNNFLYFAGYTKSTSGISTPGSHQVGYGGGQYDAMLVQFTLNGVRNWATYYGGNGHDFILGLAVEPTGNGDVFVCGQTTSLLNIATNLAYKDTLTGLNYMFLARIDTNCIRLWGSYYGGANEDMAHGIAVDAFSNVFVAGVTKSTSNISTPGTHQTTYGGGTYDACVIRFFNCPAFSTAGSNAPLCLGQTLQLTASGGVSYSWTGPNGFTSSQQNPSIPNVSYVNTGTYSVLVTNQTGCISMSIVHVTISAPNAFAISNSPVCSTQTLILSGFGGTIYNWTGPNSFTSGLQNPTIPNVTMAAAGTYTLIVEDQIGCKDTTTTTVVVNDCTGINELNSSGSYSVYPNPGNGHFTIQFQDVPDGVYVLRMFDVLGKEIYHSQYAISGNLALPIDVPSAQRGIYVLEISNGSAFYSIEKLIVH